MKWKIFIMMLALILTVSAVSAADNNITTDNLSLTQDIPYESQMDSNNEILNEKMDNFTQLSQLIDNTPENSTLELDKDYKINEIEKEEYQSHLTISKPMTIDGKGHILNGDKSKILYISANNVILKNIIFQKGTATFGGGIECVGDNLTVDNCSFEECSALDCGGSAICGNGNNYNIINSKIIQKKMGIASDYGLMYYGGIYGSGDNWNIINSSFVKCSDYIGGAIYAHGNNWNIIKSTFSQCSSITGAISSDGNNWNIINSTFTGCRADISSYDPANGGAINTHGNKWNIINSTFTKCYAKDMGGAIYITGKNSKILNCNFKDNKANKNPNWYSKYSIITTVTAQDLKTTYTANPDYTIKIYDTNGKLVDGVNVVVKINGKAFKTLKTSNGIAKFKVTKTPGTYKLTITALKNTQTKTLTVKHIVTLKSVKVKKSAKKLTLQTNLAKINGKYLAKKTVTFKFNGKTYKAKTNSKGVAKVTIKSNILKKLKVGKKITYQATYLKDTVKKTVKVLK